MLAEIKQMVSTLAGRADRWVSGLVDNVPNPYKRGQLRRYLETGRLPIGIDTSPPFPHWEGRGLLRVEDRLLAVRRVSLVQIARGWKHAYVEFQGIEKDHEVPEWEVREGLGHDPGIHGPSYTFDTTFPLGSELRSFARNIASGRLIKDKKFPQLFLLDFVISSSIKS